MNLKKIIRESLDSDWDWAQFDPVEPRKRGDIKVGDVYTVYGRNHSVRYVLEIVEVTDEDVFYKILVTSNEEDEPVDSIQSTELNHAKRLIVMDNHWVLTDSYNKGFDLKESEEWDWVKKHSFHLDLMSQNPKKINSINQIKKILFNPAVMTSDQKFKNVAYYLEDIGYMPVNLVFDKYLSYIEITEHIKIPPTHDMHLIRSGMYRGKYFVGPSVSDDELIEMSREEGSFWYEEFIGNFLPHKMGK